MSKFKSMLLVMVVVVGLSSLPNFANAASTLYCPGSNCKTVQSYLQRCSQWYGIAWPGPADGIYGSKTKASIISFQQFMNRVRYPIRIAVDGKVGPQTSPLLREWCTSFKPH